MKARSLVIPLTIIAITITVLSSAHAVSASNFTLDKSSYNPGDSGQATITVYNDQPSLIRITSIDLNLNYYYTDGRVYTQDFVTPALSMNVSSATNSQPITIQFNLPSGIAVGYFVPHMTVSYNVLNGGTFSQTRASGSDAGTPLLVSTSTSTQTMTYLFVATTILFAVVASYFALRYFAIKAPANRTRTN
jgi:hypothetical protein